MADGSSEKKALPTTKEFLIGLGIAILALMFPVFVLGLLLLCIAVAGMGSNRYGHVVAGIVFLCFGVMFPVAVLVTLFSSLAIISAGKWVAPKPQRLAS